MCGYRVIAVGSLDSPSRVAVGQGGFDKGAACTSIVGRASGPTAGPCRRLSAFLERVRETPSAGAVYRSDAHPDLGRERHRDQEGGAAHCLVSFDDRRHGPGWYDGGQLLVQAVQPLSRVLDRILEDDLLCRVLESLAGKPAPACHVQWPPEPARPPCSRSRDPGPAGTGPQTVGPASKQTCSRSYRRPALRAASQSRRCVRLRRSDLGRTTRHLTNHCTATNELTSRDRQNSCRKAWGRVTINDEVTKSTAIRQIPVYLTRARNRS